MLKIKSNNNQIKNLSNKKAYMQLFLMIVISILTQIISLLKTSVVAAQFGATVEMDAFNFSNSIGTFIFSFIGTGITTVLIPSLINNKNKRDINTFISVLYSVAFSIVIVVFIVRVPLITILTSGNSKFINIASSIMFITLFGQFIGSFSGVTNAIFQCNEKYNIPKIIGLISSISLVALVVFMPQITIYKYAIYICITTILGTMVQIILLKNNQYDFKFIYHIDFKNDEVKKMIAIFLPTVVSTGVYQISLLIDSIISSNLGEGQISILSYSNTIITMINSILLGNIMMYLYPKIAKSIKAEKNHNQLFNFMIMIMSIMSLLVIGFILVGRDGIVILYQRGKFTSEITSLVFKGTIIYIFSLPINAMRDLIYRYFYANSDTVTPLKNSIIISVLNISISIILAKKLGIYGVILGTVITSYLSFLLIMIRFIYKFGFKYSKKTLLIETIKILFSSIGAFIICKMLYNNINIQNSLLNICVFGSICVALYLIFLYVFKSKVFKIKL